MTLKRTFNRPTIISSGGQTGRTSAFYPKGSEVPDDVIDVVPGERTALTEITSPSGASTSTIETVSEESGDGEMSSGELAVARAMHEISATDEIPLVIIPNEEPRQALNVPAHATLEQVRDLTRRDTVKVCAALGIEHPRNAKTNTLKRKIRIKLQLD